MWIIASMPFWLVGTLFFVGAIASIEWKKETTDSEICRVIGGIVIAGAFFLIAAWAGSQ